MTKLVSYGIGLAVALGVTVAGWAQKAEKGTVAFSWEYVGHNQLLNLKEQKGLQEILNLPETQAVWKLGFERIGREASLRYSKGQTNPALAQMIAGFAQDLGMFESRFQLQRGTNANWILAVRLPEDRHREWSTNLWRTASQARLGEPKPRSSGWEAQGGETKYNLQFLRDKDWTILNGGYASAASQRDFVSNLSKKSGDSVLKVSADMPALASILRNEKLAHAPNLELSVLPRGSALRSEVKLTYAQDLGIKVEPWSIPTYSIREPLIGFTALQGIQGTLQKSPYLSKLGLEKAPNQLFFWAQSISPFTIFAAADVGNPKKVIDSFVKNVVPDMNQKLQNRAIGRIELNTNSYLLAWRGLPVIVPFLRPGEDKDSAFITTGFFPIGNPNPETIPAELVKEVSKKNLILYDWEITEPRLGQWKQLWEAKRLVEGMMIAGSVAPSEKWLTAISTNLGNTITEATLANPREIQIVRRSDTGFTALELVLLAHWLDGSDAPLTIQEALRKSSRTAPSSNRAVPSNRRPQNQPQPIPTNP